MIKEQSYLQKQDLIDHAKNPRNYGLSEKFDFISSEYNPSCGDMVVIAGRLQDDILLEIRFEGKGCVLSLAMASKLTEYLKGKSIAQTKVLDKDLVTCLLGLELGLNRLQCGMLSIKALQKAMLFCQSSSKN